MGADNEHKALRGRMERRLGRQVSEAAWDQATDQGFVDVALDPEYGVAREEGLTRYLTGLFRVEDGGLRARANRKPKATESLPRADPNLSARVEAVSRLAAEHAAGDEEVLRFRQRVLGRDTPMSLEEAEAYLDDLELRSVGAHAGVPLEVLRYQNGTIAYELHVAAGSPLDELRKLAEDLAKFYPWEPAQAAAFVLEGLIPLATPFMLRLPQTWHETRPTRAKLVMEVDLWMPASSVIRAYRAAQRQVLPGHNRPVSRQSLDLVNFVLAHPSESWQKRLEFWNSEHPTAHYATYRSLRWAFVRARKSLLFATYRPYLGPRSEGNRAP
jgi:hypothetical protein